MSTPLWFQKLLEAQSVINTSAVLGQSLGSKANGTLILVHFGPLTSAGVVVIEGSHDPAFTGTWANLATITWAAADRVHETFISGSFIARRVRISTAIVGGSVNVHSLITG